MKTPARLNSVIKKQKIEKSAMKNVLKIGRDQPTGIYLFQVPGRACDYAGHCQWQLRGASQTGLSLNKKIFRGVTWNRSEQWSQWCSPISLILIFFIN